MMVIRHCRRSPPLPTCSQGEKWKYQNTHTHSDFSGLFRSSFPVDRKRKVRRLMTLFDFIPLKASKKGKNLNPGTKRVDVKVRHSAAECSLRRACVHANKKKVDQVRSQQAGSRSRLLSGGRSTCLERQTDGNRWK